MSTIAENIATVDPATIAAIIAAYEAGQAEARTAARDAREEHKRAHAAMCAEVAHEIAATVETLLCFAPTPERKDWVEGKSVLSTVSNIPVTVGGVKYAVSVSMRDIAATLTNKG